MARRRGAKRRVQRVDLEWYGDEFLEIVQEHGPDALLQAAEVVRAEAERRAPRRSGKLAGSGYIGVKGRSTYRPRRYWRREKKARDGEAVIGFMAPHAHLMESGRRKRGEIRPGKRRRALRIDGQFRSRSNFRRMSSRPFVGPALEATREDIPRELAKVYRSWLERLIGA